jgi:lipopolysaccharide export system protein LptA
VNAYRFKAAALRRAIFLSVAGLILLQIGSVYADTTLKAPETVEPEAGKIQITARRLISDLSDKEAEFIGDVTARQGNTQITADSLKVFFGAASDAENTTPTQSLEKLVATGNVEIKFDNRVAVAQQAVYITAQRLMVLTGPNAMITDGENTISGETITFYRDDGRFTVEGGTGGRVKAVILPDRSGLE